MSGDKNSKERAVNAASRMRGNVIRGMLVIYDALSIMFSFFLALWFRFDLSYSSIPKNYHSWYLKTIWAYIIVSIIVYGVLQLYRSIWKFAGFFEMIRISIGCFINIFLYMTICLIFHLRMPISYFMFGIIFQFMFGIAVRFGYRLVLLIRGHNRIDTDTKPVIIYGAGAAGRMLAKDIHTSHKTGERVVAFIDDNSSIWGRVIDGIPVVGGRDDVLVTVDKMEAKKIYVAIPSASRKVIKDILTVCTEAKCEVRNLPGMFQLYTGQVSVSSMKEVAIEDLLGRDPIKVNNEEIGQFIEGKRVLITGAGGRWCNNRTNQEKSLFYRRSESFGFAIN